MDEARYLDALRRHTGRLIVQGADMLDELTARGQAPGKQWWNVAAKFGAANRIKSEEDKRASEAALARGVSKQNNDIDARRHATASQRLTLETNPRFAQTMGEIAELKSLLIGRPGQLEMDLHNNAEGRRAAVEGRPINPADLEMRPGALNPRLRNRASLPR